MIRQPLVLVFLLGWALPLAAQPGKYVVSLAAEGPELCHLTLGTEQGIGGQAVFLGPDCKKSFPWIAGVAVWRKTPAGDLALADAARKNVIVFRRLADGDGIGPAPNGVDHVITPDRPRR